MDRKLRSGTSVFHHRNAFETVFILEDSHAMWELAPDRFELDLLSKGRAEVGPASVTARSTWLTWACESCFEYCRIAWDILPDYKVSVFACGNPVDPLTIAPLLPTGSPVVIPRLKNLRLQMFELTRFSQDAQNISTGFNSTSVERVFQKLEILESEELLTAPLYRDELPEVSSDRPFFLRIVLVITEKDESKIQDIIRQSVLKNNLVHLARFEVDVILVGNDPTSGGEARYQKLDCPGDVFVNFYSARNGADVLEAMKNCITWDLRLSRTIITDIPMKEDAKSGGTTSFSYDVELFHPCLMDEQRQVRPGGEMLRMKWVKPIRGPMPGYGPMDGTIPIRASASDPTTRPTQCLVGYVVDGNAIFVESKEPPVAGKLFLCGGKICLQQLVVGGDRPLDDFSALAELPGGRVASYRVKETVAMLSMFPIDIKGFPLKSLKFEEHAKMTAYFPLVYNETIVFLLPQLIGLFDALVMPTVSEDVWASARAAIEEVLEMEKKGQTLPVPQNHILLQNVPQSQRRTECYPILWAELDMILEANSVRSSKHLKLWTYFKAVLRKPLREDIKAALRERAKSHLFTPPPAPPASAKTPDTTLSPRKRKSRPDFEGRIKWGRYGKLYQNLQKPDKNEGGGLIHASFEL